MTSNSNGKRQMRSKLFVPGSKPTLFAKAMAAGADCVCFDLEDAVSAENKDTARAEIVAYLKASDALPASTMIRVNTPDFSHFQADIAAAVEAGVDYVNVPKVESRESAVEACEVVLSAASAAGVAAPSVLVNIETPRALGNAAAIAGAHAAIIGLQLGYGDLFLPFGIDRSDVQALGYVRMACKMAAAEAGIEVYDGAHFLKDDFEGFRQEAVAAKRMGFAGKSCILPAQVAHANSVFGPDSVELAFAARVLEEFDRRSPEERGAFQIDGQMIDQVFIDWARLTVKRAVAIK